MYQPISRTERLLIAAAAAAISLSCVGLLAGAFLATDPHVAQAWSEAAVMSAGPSHAAATPCVEPLRTASAQDNIH